MDTWRTHGRYALAKYPIFLLFSRILSMFLDMYHSIGYDPAQTKQYVPDALAPNARTSRGRTASSERTHGRLIQLSLLASRRRRASAPACRPPATSVRPARWRQASAPAPENSLLLLCTRALAPAYTCAASCTGDAPPLADCRHRASVTYMPSIDSSSSCRPPRRGARTSLPRWRPAPVMQGMQMRE